jgi:phosphate transport system protein
MSPADSADRPAPLRVTYGAELEQLRLQVEVMGVLVDQNLERMRQVLETGDPTIAGHALAADDDIDAMNVSLTERCYEVLGRENPMASDLRLVVSVIRVSSELERIGDLSLRVVRAGVDHDLLTSSPESFDVAQVMASEAVELVRAAMRAWATEDVDLAASLSKGSPSISLDLAQMIETLLRLSGPDATAIAMRTMIVGQALERIADHAAILGSRLRYLVTGDPRHLAAEIRL